MRVRYSITTVALPHLSLREMVDLASGLGYDGLELRVRRVPPSAAGQPFSFWGNHKEDLPPEAFVERAPEIRRLFDGAGLAVPALASNATAVELDDVKRLAEGAAILGCPLVRIGAPRRYDGGAPYRAIFDETVDAFREALRVVASFGVRGLLEIHGGTITVSAGLALRLVERFPPSAIGVVYDSNNMVREGYEGLRLGLDVLGPYLAHVHVGGHAPEPGERDDTGTLRWSWRACDLSDGLIEAPRLLEELRRVDYQGFITVEDFRTDAPPEQKFAAAIRYLRALDRPA